MPWSSGGCRVHSEQGATAAKETTVYWDALGRVASTLMGVIIPLCSAVLIPHPFLSFPEQDGHGHTEASSWNDREDYGGAET